MKEFYAFASFHVDVKKRRLMRGDEIIPLTPKEFDVLFLLIENAGRAVEKDELLDAVWKDTFVEEATLTRNISWLRKKLADHGETDAKIIETVPKRGYRFLPEVTKSSAVASVGEVEIVQFIEERIVQEIQIEESIEIVPSPNDNEIAQKPIFNLAQKTLPAAPVKQKFSTLWIIAVILILSAAAFAVYRGYFSKKPSDLILASKIAPFSGLPGRENSPVFSPDGKQLSFTWDGGIDGAASDIYVKLIGAGEPVRLTNTPVEEINPIFSPDGKSIAFVRIFPDHNEIILIPALGGAERKIYDRASYASLSFAPDGTSLAAAELDLSADNAGIFTINLETGAKARLTTPAAPAVDLNPRFSPDGKSLAFIRYFSSFRREVFVVPAIGGEPRQITDD
ncbi:MAG: winged helix-turn-helix domain-containing protein, partial [Acidobacteriota bacterium]|nr:winged helix-turn-helix domain-containing protein [Acidobacteriota bacterium]